MAEQALNGGSRRPRLALRVGITGHRSPRLAAASFDAVRQECEAVLGSIAEQVRAVQHRHADRFQDAPPLLKFVTALAEGADTLGAEAAVAAGYSIDVCLPFGLDEYRNDFTTEAGARLSSALALADAMLELPGERNAEAAAYEAVGKLVLQQSDLLIAVWDGDSARGRGGSAQIIAEAVADHVPVIHIRPESLDAPILLWSGLDGAVLEQPSLDRVARGDAARHMPALIAALAAPPMEKVDDRMLNRFLDASGIGSVPALPYPLLLAAAGVRTLRRQDLEPPSAGRATEGFRALVGDFASNKSFGAFLSGALAERYGYADAEATYFATLFRSGYVSNFALSALAVALALSGIMFPAAKTFLITAELLVICSIVLNTRRGARLGWHERWMDNRHLAERLRTLSLSALLGNLSLRNVEDAAAIPSWVAWYSRATAREVGLPPGTMNDEYVSLVRNAALSLIDDQMQYHKLNAERMHRLEHRLHRFGEWLFGATIAACAIWLLVSIVASPYATFLGMGLTETVTVATALLPAVGAAIYGIRMQGDFAGVAEHSVVTGRRLSRLRRAIETDPPDFQRLAGRIRRLSDIMLADVERWRLTYQTRPLTLPG